MFIAENIIQFMRSSAEKYTVKRIQVGLIYSVVQLNNHTTGVAYTFPKGKHCGTMDRPLSLAGRKASELIAFLTNTDLVLSSLALATVNAVLASMPPPRGAVTGDVLKILDIHRGDTVCMVGCFLPLITALKRKGAKVTSIDEIPKSGSVSSEEVNTLLPHSQVAIITATSIINNTIDHLLELAQSCREVTILGPSTPLLRKAFTGTPVTHISGIRVLEPEPVIQIIGEGGGFRQFKKFCQKVNMGVSCK
jgi:uncharacterized protein (DUF4213/DUF364 family)